MAPCVTSYPPSLVIKFIYVCPMQPCLQIWAVDRNNVQESTKLRMVFDVMFMGDSLTIAITDTCNRLMVKNHKLILIFCYMQM